MAALDTTIALPNGHANGYHDSDILANGAAQEVESATDLPDFQRTQEKPETDVAKSTVAVPPRAQQTAKAKPGRRRTVKQSHGSTDGAIKADKNRSPSHPRIKYVSQAELDKELAKLEALSQSALAGDSTALDKLRLALDDCPHVWRRLADLQYLVELKLISLVAGKDPLRAEAFRKRASELRHHLLDCEPSSLAVSLCASRAVACWMFVQFLELRALESGDLRCIKQLEQAERRFQIAMRSFAMARQMDVQLQRLAQSDSQGQ